MGLKRKNTEQGRKGGKRERSRNDIQSTKSGSTKQSKQTDNLDLGEVDEHFIHYASSDDEIKKEDQSNDNGFKRSVRDAVLDADSDNDGDSDDEMEDEEAEIKLGEAQEGESDVEVTLDFYDPRPEDIPALSNFLDPWIKRIGKEIGRDELSKTICAQTRVGTTVRVEDDEAPVGFISCLNVRRHADLLSGLRTRLRKVSKNTKDTQGDEFIKVIESCSQGKGRFENEKMGLILTERVVNMPPAIVPKLLEAIFCEIEWAIEDEPTQELREDYRFGWYLYITEAFTENVLKGEEAREKVDNKRKKQKKDNSESPEEERIGFFKVEDEAWFKHASQKMSWSVATDPDRNDSSGRKVVAMLIAAKQVPDVRKMVDELVGVSQHEAPDDDGQEEEN